ncbi:hypothetical protein D9M73_193250 [compost metagenome]
MLKHVLTCVEQAGRHLALDGDRRFQLVGYAADDAVEIGFGIGQVDFGGVQVVFRQGATGGGLVKVGSAAYTPFAPQTDLIVDAQVSLQVVLGQGHQLPALEHF